MVPHIDFSIVSTLADAGPNLGRAAGRLHPLIVHFPIALGLVAVGVEWWRGLSRKQGMSPLTLPLLAIAAVSAVFATASGWMNANFEYGNDDSSTLALHRWIGTGTSVVFVALTWWCWLLSAELMKGSVAALANLGSFRWAALVGGIAVSVTGHLGGDLVHGEGYLTKVLFPASSGDDEYEDGSASTDNIADAASDGGGVQTVALTADEQFFLSDVRPIFEARCFECHGSRKQKGGLRMDSKSWLFNGEEEDWTVLPGKAVESLLVHRVELDRADPDAMPPEGDALTADEIGKIRKWIDAGAPYPEVPIASIGAPGISSAATNAALAAAGTVAIAGGSVVEISPAMRAKADAAAKALIARGVLVQPLAAESVLLDVNASRADPAIGDAEAGLLADIAPVVANLNLSKSAITDGGLTKIGGMPQLERLRLDGTAVGDAGLAALGTLERLESINLVGTKVTKASSGWFGGQPKLQRVYVWQTELDTPEATSAIAAGVSAAGRVSGLKFEVIGKDLPLAQPTTPPMPEEPAKEAAAPEQQPAK